MRCRVGDLAVILGDTENNGLIVSVVGPDQPDVKHDWQGLTWWVRCSVPLKWWEAETGDEHFAHEGPIPDELLFPIRGTCHQSQLTEEIHEHHA